MSRRYSVLGFRATARMGPNARCVGTMGSAMVRVGDADNGSLRDISVAGLAIRINFGEGRCFEDGEGGNRVN